MSQDNDDYWDFYSCQIEDKPHSTMVNMSCRDTAPINGLGIFLAIEICLQHPNPQHGMSTDTEFETLSRIEDLVFDHDTNDLRYIARQTGDNKRKFYFYGRSADSTATLMRALTEAFPTYEISRFSFQDPTWQTYLEDLYPYAMAVNEISNRHVLYRLEREGDDGSVPREIDHSVVFKKKTNMRAFEAQVKDMGFTVKVTATGLLDKTYDLLVQRVDAPSSIDPVTWELSQLAESLGGKYDGWGCLTA